MKVHHLIRELAKCDPEWHVDSGDPKGVIESLLSGVPGDPPQLMVVPPEGSPRFALSTLAGDADAFTAILADAWAPKYTLPQQAQNVLSAIGANLVAVGPNVYCMAIDFEPNPIDVAEWRDRQADLKAAMSQAIENALSAFGWDETRCGITLDFPAQVPGLEPVGLPHVRAHAKLTARVEAERWLESSTGVKFPRRID